MASTVNPDASLASKRQALQLAVNNSTVIPVPPAVAAAPYRRVLPNYGPAQGHSGFACVDTSQLPVVHPFKLRSTPIKGYARPIA
jgi:hypothetical protein